MADDATVFGIVTVDGGDAGGGDPAPGDLLEPGASDGNDSVIIVDQDGGVFTVHDALSGAPNAWTPSAQASARRPGGRESRWLQS